MRLELKSVELSGPYLQYSEGEGALDLMLGRMFKSMREGCEFLSVEAHNGSSPDYKSFTTHTCEYPTGRSQAKPDCSIRSCPWMHKMSVDYPEYGDTLRSITWSRYDDI